MSEAEESWSSASSIDEAAAEGQHQATKNAPSTGNDDPTNALSVSTKSFSRPLNEQVREYIEAFVVKHEEDGWQTPQDVLRLVHQESHLLYQTHVMRDSIKSDPFEQLTPDDNIKSTHFDEILRNMKVTEYNHITTLFGYVSIQATISIQRVNQQGTIPHGSSETDDDNGGYPDEMMLSFRYERDGIQARSTRGKGKSDDVGTNVRYEIELAPRGPKGPKEVILWANILAASQFPSPLKPVNVNDEMEKEFEEGEDGWEDMEEGPVQDTKRARKGGTPSSKNGGKNGDDDDHQKPSPAKMKDEEDLSKEDNTDDVPDRFIAGIDPDALPTLLRHLGFCTDQDRPRKGRKRGSRTKTAPIISDDTAAFFLLTFPYFEHEWDIVGMILEAVFGPSDDDDVE